MKTTYTTKFNKQLNIKTLAIKDELIQKQKTNKVKMPESIERDYIKSLKYRRDYKLRMKREPDDIEILAFNEYKNPFKEELIEKFMHYKENYVSSCFVDLLVQEYLESHIEKHKQEFNSNKSNYLKDEDFMKNLSIESSLAFLTEYCSIENYLNEYYLQNKTTKVKVDKTEKIDKNKIADLTGLSQREHTILWEAFINNGIFINNPRLVPMKDFEAPFKKLTGFSGNQFVRKKNEITSVAIHKDYTNIIKRLKEVINYLEEKQ